MYTVISVSLSFHSIVLSLQKKKTLLTLVVDGWLKCFEAIGHGALCLRDKGCHVCRLHMRHLDLWNGG